MKWMITSLLVSGGNIWLMLAFASSKLGPTPLSLPILLAAVTLGASIGSVVSVIIGKVRHSQLRIAHLVAAAPWAVATVFNLWAFQGVLYVT